MTDEVTQAFQLGQMDARLSTMEKDMSEVKGDVKTLLARSAEGQGSRSTLLTVGGGSATLGGLIVAAGQWLSSITGQPQHTPERVPIAPTLSQPLSAPVDNTGH